MPVWVRTATITAVALVLAVIGAVMSFQAYVYRHGLNVNLKAVVLSVVALGFIVALVATVLSIRSRRTRSE